MNTDTKQTKRCLCGAPIATMLESPIAHAARLCKPCWCVYYEAGCIEKIVTGAS